MESPEYEKDGSRNGHRHDLMTSAITSERGIWTAVPDAAIQWIAYNCPSDTELAILSNVSRRWRNVVGDAIISLVFEVAPGPEVEVSDVDNTLDPKEVDRATPSPSLPNLSHDTKCTKIPYLVSLLLPSMLIEQMRVANIGANPSATVESKSHQSKRRYGRTTANTVAHPFLMREHFCLAWFHPMGIQVAHLASKNTMAKLNCHETAVQYITADQILLREGAIKDCVVSEWHSYRGAEEILRPFCYSKSFIEHMISSIERKIGQKSTSFHSDTAYPAIDGSFAVRGATVARPWIVRRSRKLANRISIENLREYSPRIIVLERQHSDSATAQRQLAVQFLSYDQSRAVCMKTGVWKCGEVDQPITVFLVGIATEDGVFFSGWNRRFLLGHTYPDTAQCIDTERSNVCISTESTVPASTTNTGSATNFIESLRLDSDLDSRGVCAPETLCSSQFYGSDSSDEEGEYLSSNASTPPMSDAAEDEIFRGRTGPGKWHCYTAVFDGKDSILRIDGFSESHLESNQQSCGNGSLDGLTIGSDHRFHLSLCFGDGSEGEGEGAISELAIFKGRLPIEDIMTIERHLMNKHGISKADEISCAEEEMRRKIHALITQPPPWPSEGAPTPLRLAAQHPSVAWVKVNPVTGNQIAVKRIGCKSTALSSDW